MSLYTQDFVDPTIPGLSGRDLISRAAETLQSTCSRLIGQGARDHCDYQMRRDVSRLNASVLRDIGLDRNFS